MSRLFVTGFGPFLKVKENPSAWIAERLDLPYEILEVSFKGVETFLDRFDPSAYDGLLLMGVHGGARRLRMEMRGRNRIGRTADVTGKKQEGIIIPDGPDEIASTLWSGKLPEDPELRSKTRVTHNAGRYLCNYSYYRALQCFTETKVGFLHIPPAEIIRLNKQLDLIGCLLESPDLMR